MRAWRSVSTVLVERVPVWFFVAVVLACAAGSGLYLGVCGIPEGWWGP